MWMHQSIHMSVYEYEVSMLQLNVNVLWSVINIKLRYKMYLSSGWQKKIIICGAKHGDIPPCFATELTALTDDQPLKHCCYWQPDQQLAISLSFSLSRLYNSNLCNVLLIREVCIFLRVCVRALVRCVYAILHVFVWVCMFLHMCAS